MTNRTDFFQPAQTRLALPAATVSILLDGTLCSCLELIEIVQSGWPEFGWARLACNPAGAGLAGEEFESEPAIGQAICIRQVYNTGPGASTLSFSVFAGQIESIETRLEPSGERVEIIAKDFSANLKCISVYGQRVSSSGGLSVFLAGVDTVFNDNGRANASTESIENNGRSYTAFAADPRRAKLWSCAEAINYLLCEYLPSGQLQTPSLEQLQALTEGRIVRDLDVTGLNLLQCLYRCCERIGLEFKFVPRSCVSGPSQAIVFYRNATGRSVELSCQQTGEQLSISKTNIARLHSRKDYWPVTHKYIGQGDFRVYEATFELVKAWDSSLENNDYDRFSPSTNPDFYQIKDVYRKWCLNEAGDYSNDPYNEGDAFDFSKVFEGGNFVHRRRRFWPALTTDSQNRSLGYFLEVSFDNGLHWWQYLYAFNNLLDECGVWLSSERLDVDSWVAAQKGVLKFRITASVISDERLSCAVADGPTDSVAPVVEHVITLPRQFRYRRVSGQSIFAGACDNALGLPDEVDDSAALFEFVRQKAAVSSAIIETVNVQTPYLAFGYQPGDKVEICPESRDISNFGSDSRSVSWIERVQMDFKNQCTNLKVVRKRK